MLVDCMLAFRRNRSISFIKNSAMKFLNAGRELLPVVLLFTIFTQRGEAKTPEEIKACSAEKNCAGQGYAPICGEDMIEYINQCALECRDLKPSGAGRHPNGGCKETVKKTPEEIKACRKEKDCAGQPFSPICAEDNRTYINQCELDCRDLKAAANSDGCKKE